MIILKQVIHYQDSNSVEATWVDAGGAQVKCHSYADVQMQMFRDDVAALGGKIADHAAMIAAVEAAIVPIVIPLETAKAMQITALSQAYQAAITSTVSYMSTTFQSDPASVNNLVLSLAALTPAGATPAGFYWVDASNNHVPMTLAQLQGLAAAMYAPGWSAFKNLQSKKASVKAAGAVADVQAITF